MNPLPLCYFRRCFLMLLKEAKMLLRFYHALYLMFSSQWRQVPLSYVTQFLFKSVPEKWHISLFGKCLMTLSTFYPRWVRVIWQKVHKGVLFYLKSSFILRVFLEHCKIFSYFLNSIPVKLLHHTNWDRGSNMLVYWFAFAVFIAMMDLASV